VCVRDGLAASVCVYNIYRTFAASVEPLPRGWRAVAFPRWLHDQSGSTWLIVILIIIRKIFVVASAACVYETGLLLVCACRAPAASVEPLPPGSRAVAFPRWLQVLSCSTWLIVLVASILLVFSVSAALALHNCIVIVKYELPSQALLLLCHLDDDLVIITYILRYSIVVQVCMTY